jgi:hypothetical protein
MKLCRRCGETKPLNLFHRRTLKSGNIGTTPDCAACRVALRTAQRKTPEGAIAHRERVREYRQRILSKARGLGVSGDATKVDAVRRAMAEHPPEIAGEAEMVAYFRGFVAGAKRSAEEGERFERLKDLVHRIAAEAKMQRGMIYEDVLSAAYEGLLKFLRGSAKATSLEHERNLAAKAIRWQILDCKRVDGPLTRRGGKNRHPLAESGLHLVEDHPRPSETLQARAEASYALPEAVEAADIPARTKRLLGALAEGCSFREAGEREGITESRACQIVRELGRKMPELEALLA